MTFQVLNREHLYKCCIAVVASYGALITASADEARPVTDVATPSAQFADMRGQYEFAGGRLLTITGGAYKIRAQLDGRPEVAMVRVGASTLQAADQSFTLTFEQHDNGTITRVDLEERPGEKVDARPGSANPAG
ncbi:hypothetical protein [Herbaspirillum sp. SJZ107]|uniref:hypothetical protein n=1 Tax=Herbaspirillum sp. SJZ107 TaxID=2572881 RepID=UPI00114FE2EE|nr:hypothetical protein [Herbaspirillum sp. SJZ107]TQK11065.1 hypothetical protein FBX97_0997 [Herbaspirillum sp. SJZ107]